MDDKIFNGNFSNKYGLIMSNDIKGCIEDVNRLEKILSNYNFKIIKKIICYPKNEIVNFITKRKLNKEDLLYIHYSGHGIKRGKRVDGKYQILSSWINPDKSVVLSDEIDTILSNIKCTIILSTECCHSETFGDYYKGLSPFIFLGTSELNRINRTFSISGEPVHGCLVHFFEYLLKNNIEIDIKNILNLSKEYFTKNRIKNIIIYKKKDDQIQRKVL